MKTQREAILKALKSERLTKMDLCARLGVSNPWARLSELRAEGVPIRKAVVIKDTRWKKKARLTYYWVDAGECAECGEPNPPGREKLYCSDKCRAKHYRRNKK